MLSYFLIMFVILELLYAGHDIYDIRRWQMLIAVSNMQTIQPEINNKGKEIH